MTDEQRQFGTGWLKCLRCGLVDAAVHVAPNLPAGTEPYALCDDAQRCRRVILGESLGGAPLEVGPLVRFELDAGELAAVDAAVEAWQSRPSVLEEARQELDEIEELEATR